LIHFYKRNYGESSGGTNSIRSVVVIDSSIDLYDVSKDDSEEELVEEVKVTDKEQSAIRTPCAKT
jgi:hypothetical protein